MKFSITADGSQPVILADHGRDGVEGFVPTIIYNDELLQFVQGLYAKPKDRGNISHQYTFIVSQEHASITAAQRHILMIGQNTPRTGTLNIELEDQTTQFVAREAVCRVQPIAYMGRKSTVSYTLKFGEISEAVQVLGQTGNTILTSDGNPVFVNKE